MKTGKFEKAWIVLAICFGAALVFQVGAIQVNLYVGGKAWNAILDGLREQFPGVEFRGGCSYERQQVHVCAFGAGGPERQAEIRDWLLQFKQERNLGVEVWLELYEEGAASEPAAEVRF